MCRLLYIRSQQPFPIHSHLKVFAAIARNSIEYQGHGWGLAYLQDGEWKHYRNLKPVWEDKLDPFGDTRLMLVHARSAFQDRDITIENNMPFYDQRYVFIFNGELQGVRIQAPGRIGAEKVFNFIKRFDHGDMEQAITKAREIIEKRSKYIKAMNIIIADKEAVYVSTQYNENREYFTMHYKESAGNLVICSEKYPGEEHWQALPNKSMKVYR
jgi:predicted glutamine amidotransferase